MVEETEAFGIRSCLPCYLCSRPKTGAYAYLVAIVLFKPPELIITSISTSALQQVIFCLRPHFSYVSGYLQDVSLLMSFNNAQLTNSSNQFWESFFRFLHIVTVRQIEIKYFCFICFFLFGGVQFMVSSFITWSTSMWMSRHIYLSAYGY